MNITRQLNVNASAGLLWHILAEEYDQVGEWTTAVLYSGPNPDLPVGEGRVCATPAFGDVKETITQFDESARSFSYAVDIADGPFFLRGVDNTWRIESQGNDQSVVFMDATVHLLPVFAQLMGPAMKGKMGKGIDRILEELKYYAETGEIHPRKQERLGAAAPAPA